MPTIEFTCYNSNTVKYFKPVLAKTVLPDWWKTMKIQEMTRFTRQHTIRSCPAMDDWVKSGWYLLANKDIRVICGKDRDGQDTDHESFVTEDIEGTGYSSPPHPREQFGNVFNFLGKNRAPIRDAFKMKNPWNIITPKGYSCFYIDPFLHQNEFFATWPGIIDTDKFNKNMDNAQIIFYPKVDHSFTILKGTPLCQIIPFKREKWVASYQFRDVDDYIKNLSHVTSEQKNMDERPMIEHKRMQPDSNVFKAGPYRKYGYWSEKGQYFKEESPPPECPFHKTEESSEIQLEFDFDVS